LSRSVQLRRALTPRNAHRYRRPFIQYTFYSDRALVHFDDGFGYEQPQAGPAFLVRFGIVDPVKRLEYMVTIFIRNTDYRVSNRNQYVGVFLPSLEYHLGTNR
jgi:hypothetical protein